MKQQRHTVIRELVGKAPIASQDELRRKLAGRGFHVTQATLSRDIHELRLSKGPDGYSIRKRRRIMKTTPLAGIREVLESFGLEVRQAIESAGIDYYHWRRSADRRGYRLRGLARGCRNDRGRRYGLIICPDMEQAKQLEDQN